MSAPPTGARATARKLMPLLLLGGIAFVLGRWSKGDAAPSDAAQAGDHETHAHDAAKGSEWTCSMHPQIRMDEPGQCPICGMDLIPVSDAGDDGANPAEVVLSERARALARVRTTVVEAGDSSSTLNLLGRIDYDETRLRTVTAWTAGRIDRLKVRVTGARIGAGQTLATLYSPEVYAAFGDVVAAAKQAARLTDSMHGSGELAAGALEAARQRLRLLGVEDREITRVEQEGEVPRHVSIRSPYAGTVLERLVDEGTYVKAGTPLLRVADLSRVWVQIDAYESDLARLQKGQTLQVQVRSLPDERFEGRVAFIDPVVDPKRRTARVRVEVGNRDGRLRPGMFAEARIDAGGADGQLLIPHSAALFTGRRSVVYVELPDTPRPTYAMRVVELGARSGSHYPVLSGLRAGDRVVTEGAFAIDAELQLRGGSSMMTRPGDSMEMDDAGHAPQPTSAAVAASTTLVESYLVLQRALGDDDLAAAKGAAVAMLAAAEGSPLREAAKQAVAAGDLGALRTAFSPLSAALTARVREHGNPLQQPLRTAYCPMAFDGAGGSWLQTEGELHNPYYGAAMLTCGEFQGEALPPRPEPQPEAATPKTKTKTKAKSKAKPKAKSKTKVGTPMKKKPSGGQAPSTPASPPPAPMKHDHSKHHPH